MIKISSNVTSNICTVSIVVFVVMSVFLVAIELFVQMLKKHKIYEYRARSAEGMDRTKCAALRKWIPQGRVLFANIILNQLMSNVHDFISYLKIMRIAGFQV